MPKGLSIRAFAKADGCNEKLVRRKVQSGHLTPFDDGSIDPKLVGTGWRARVRTPGADSADTPEVSAPIPRTVRRAPAGADDDPESLGEIAERILEDALGEGRPLLNKMQAETLKENYIALMRQLEYDKAVGNVAVIDEFVTAVASEYAIVKNRLFNIGSKIAPRAAVMRSAEEIKALIDREVTQALQELTLDVHGPVAPNGPDREV